ncbi:Papain family cysteine protease [Daejeonella rubra]|uniref:Papain family cysteine protease n=1 Tax=Daejeonella rubra TaxID=990371 RepID=A0A1G9MLB5_9SPHI|nr:C1 family peptidase [Daejeonella rubra]SDL74853.1 Papain family cysteine protease [Daejeonella rubra]
MPTFLKRVLFPLCLILTYSKLSAQVNYTRGLEFDNTAYEQVLKKAKLTRSLTIVPKSFSIKMFAPYPESQGQFGTCTAWASAYCGRTIVQAVKNNWTDRDFITKNAYSPAFLYRVLRPDDPSCAGGSSIPEAFSFLKSMGVPGKLDQPEPCIGVIDPSIRAKAADGKIKDFMRLFDAGNSKQVNIQAVKKSISEKKPVVFGMICPPSFNNAGELWTPKEDPLQSYGGHAMCVVGYDDEKFGGAFEIQNSWGKYWGNAGYTWIKYDDFARFTPYAFEFVDLPEPAPAKPDLSGQIRFVLASGQEMPVNLLVSTRGLKVVPAKTTPGPLTIYQSQNSYSSGTKFRMYISNNEPAYVYAISTDLSNEITKIFPNEEGISAALTDSKNDIAIPDEDHFIEFDNKPGKDFLCVLYSKNELDINGLIQKIRGQSGTFNERIFNAIGDQLVDPQNMDLSKDKIAFNGFTKGKSIVSMVVELEHF